MKTVPGWTEMIRTVGNNTWKVNRDCVYLNGERFINGVELASQRMILVEDVRTAIQLRDEFDDKFPEVCICPLTESE